jgi:ABC-type branched-subunit amino acid transport system substrate-binding protein
MTRFRLQPSLMTRLTFRWLHRQNATWVFLLLSLTALSGCTTVSISFSQINNPLEQFLNNPLRNPFRSQTSGSALPQTKPLKLGMLFSLSGNLAKYGQTMRDTTGLLVETVNGCGGVAGQAVQMLLEDDQSNASAGKAAIARLLQNQANVVIGAIGSEISNASVDLAVQAKTVQISPASANPVLTQRAQKGDFQGYWFRTMPPDMFQGEALAELAFQRGFKTITVLAVDNDYGNSIVQAFQTTYKQLGGTEPSVVVRYSPYAGIYGVDLYRPFVEQPDAVLVVAEPELGGTLLRAAYESGLWSGNTRVLLTGSMKTENLAERVGQSTGGRYNASGVLGVAPIMTTEASEEFRERYKKRFNREPALYDANTWDAAAVAVLAAESAQRTGNPLQKQVFAVANGPGIEVRDVCQALALVRDGREINYQGPSGSVDFNQDGDVIGNYDIWTIDYTGKIKTDSTIVVGQPKKPGAESPVRSAQ